MKMRLALLKNVFHTLLVLLVFSMASGFTSCHDFQRVTHDAGQSGPITPSNGVAGSRESLTTERLTHLSNVQLRDRINDQLQEDLQFLSGLQTDRQTSELFRVYFGGSFSLNTLSRWMNQHISRFEIVIPSGEHALSRSMNNLSNEGLTVPAANISNNGPEHFKAVMLSPGYLFPGISPVYRLSLIFHEGRHSDDAVSGVSVGHGHVVCPRSTITSEYAGQIACDEDARGAYGYQVVFLREMYLHCSNCSVTDRRQAYRGLINHVTQILSETDRRTLTQGLPALP